MYHQVANLGVDPDGSAVSPDHFAQHLEYIKRTCYPMRLADLVDALSGHSLPHWAVVITFDDGYVDNLTNAYSLLQSAQIPATVFVASGGIDSSSEFWWHKLEQILLTPTDLPERVRVRAQGREYEWDTTSSERRQLAYYAIGDLLRPLPAADRDEVLTDLANWTGFEPTACPDYRLMTSAELMALAQDGLVELGAHTVTHPVLSALPADAQRAEIVEGRRRIEAIIGQSVLTFAYPYGEAPHFTAETVEIVKAAGFRAACTTIYGRVEPGDDLFQLRRCPVHDWDLKTFKRRLASFFLADRQENPLE